MVSYTLGKDKEDTTEWGKVELYFQTVKQASFTQRSIAYDCRFTLLQKSNQSKNGIPVAREVRAMNDLRIATSPAGTPYQVRFIAYNAEVRP